MNKLEISDVCRCCLSQQMNLTDLFESSDSMNLAEAIQDICGINIYPDNCLSDQICDDCLECLKVSYTFRMRTQQSDKTLRGILEGSIILIVKEYIADDGDTNISNQTDSLKSEKDSQSDEKTNDNADQELDVTFNTDSKTGQQCPYCQKDFVHLKNLRVHMRRHFTEGKYKCSHCSNKYHIKFDLHRHMTKIHSDGHSFKCDLFDKEFPTKPEWNRQLFCARSTE